MKKYFIILLNKLYLLTLAKEKNRQRLNDFLYFFLWKLTFKLHSILPVKKKFVLFVANAEDKLPNDFEILFREFLKNGYNAKCLYKFKGGSKIAFRNELSKIRADLKFQRNFARAQITFLDEYYLPAYANKPRKDAHLVRLWHGCGAFKRFSYSVKDSNWGLKSNLFERYKVHKNYTEITVSSPFIIPKWKEAFDASDEIMKTWGVPRTDIFFDNDFVRNCRKELEKEIPEIKGKKLILWAPTLRGNDVQSSYAERAIDFLKLKNELGDGYAFLLKLHPRIADGLSFSDEEKARLSGFLFDISKTTSINTALCASDICITDYSSLIFEYSLLSRPMIFYAYDLEEYDSDRSFYYDYESFVPGEIAKTTEQLIVAIKNADSDFDKQKVLDFREKFMSSCDGKCAERIFKELTKNNF